MNIISKQWQAYRTQLEPILDELHELTQSINHTELQQTVDDLRQRIHEPFMFVIVGEVKAGKSSFINALLDTEKEICKVAPSPMTDTIQQIVYGEEHTITQVNPYLKRITEPVEILKEIAIVDTPGTNTIVDHHQEITERFVPASDLIVFVFEAKNPYRQSAWTFFDFIQSDWRKKVIFVLQQKDLMEADDLVVNINGVHEQAQKKGIPEPNVFAVSAKQEQEGQKEESGFKNIRDYITKNITGGKAPVLKLKNSINTSQNINEKIKGGLDIRREQFLADQEFRGDISGALKRQQEKSNYQVDQLVENLLAAYDRTTGKTEKELDEGLSFFSLIRRSFASIFTKQTDVKTWLKGIAQDMEKDLNTRLKDKLNEGVTDIADSVQDMAKMIDLKIRNSQTILKDNHEIFSNIAERRANVLKDLQQTFSRFLSQSENFTDDSLTSDSENLSPNLATGSGLAVIGVIITAVTNGVVFDITGGVLTAVGLLFAGVSVGLQKRKVMRNFRQEISNGREQLEEEVTDKLKRYIAHIKDRIDDNFDEFDQLLLDESNQLDQLENLHSDIIYKLENMERELDKVL